MKKFFVLLFLSTALVGLLWNWSQTQTRTTTTLETNQTITGLKTFTPGLVVGGFTKAGLPAAGTAGRIARVTDVIGIYVDDGSGWRRVTDIEAELATGADLGAKINAIDTALGTSPGTIHVASESSGSTISTAIVLTNAHNLTFGAGRWVFTAGITAKMGSQISGVAEPGNNDDQGTTLEHNFNGDFIVFDGSGTANRGTGGGVRNLRILNTFAAGDLNGNAIRITGTSASQRAGKIKLENILITGNSATNRWTRAIFCDGAPLTGTNLILDLDLQNIKVANSGTNSEDARFESCSNVSGDRFRVSSGNNGAQTLGITITGTATAQSSNIHFTNSNTGTVVIDRAGLISFTGGSLVNISRTANSTSPIRVDAAQITNSPAAADLDSTIFGMMRFTGGAWEITGDIQLRGANSNVIAAEAALNLDSNDGALGVRINRLGATNAPFTVKEAGTNNDNFRVAGDAAGRATFHNSCDIITGAGAPETVVTGDICDIYLRTDGGAGTTFCVKESGIGNTGWVCK